MKTWWPFPFLQEFFSSSVSQFSVPLHSGIVGFMRVRPVLVFVLLTAALSAQQSSRSVRIEDDSDWWSSIRTHEPIWNKVDPVRTPNSTLGILGISLLDHQFWSAVTKRFGPTVEVERGDAANGRHQYCYVSSESGLLAHLVFEVGEVDSGFYLFSGGPDWNGSRYRKPSKLVSDKIGTRSGLRLGLTRAEVEAILGKPTLAKGARILYVRSVSVKATPEELKRARANEPNISEKDLEENYGHYDFSTQIEVRFKDSKATYLAISQSETD